MQYLKIAFDPNLGVVAEGIFMNVFYISGTGKLNVSFTLPFFNPGDTITKKHCDLYSHGERIHAVRWAAEDLQ